MSDAVRQNDEAGPKGAVEVPRATLLHAWHWPHAAALLGGISVVAALARLVLGKAAAAPIGVTWYLGCMAAGLAVLVQSQPRRAREPVPVRASPEGIFIDGKLVARREEIKSGIVVPTVDKGPMLRLERAGFGQSPIAICLDSLDQGRAMLAALQLDPGHTVGIAKALSPYHNWSIGIGIAGFVGLRILPIFAKGLGSTIAGPLFVLALLLSLAGIFSYFIKTKVTVGTDGVLLEWLGTKRFIPMADIEQARVSAVDPCIVNVLRISGREEQIVVGLQRRRSRPNIKAQNEARALCERIEEARASAGSGGGSAAEARVLSRSTRSIRDWVTDLRRSASAEGMFRQSPVLADDLWRLLEDAKADVTARAAAAVALSRAAGAQDRARLRVAAQATAAPKLRIAIEAAADDDEAQMVEALTAIAAEEVAEKKARA